MKRGFNLAISSDLDYEDPCAEIYFNDQFVAILTQEKGFENLEIQIYAPENNEKILLRGMIREKESLNTIVNSLKAENSFCLKIALHYLRDNETRRT